MTVVANDQFTSGEEEFMTRMWAAHRIKGNAEGSGFEKDKSEQPQGETDNCSTGMNTLL